MARLVDLSLGLEHQMPAHASFPSPIVLPYVSHAESKAAGLGDADDPFTYAVNFIAMIEHVGTHVDAPRHLGEGGATIEQCPLELFAGEAVCLDVSQVGDLGDIDVEELEAAEERAGVRVDGHIVLLYSGFHDRHWPNASAVTSNPGLTAAATHWLADRGSRVHGVEGPSTDKAGTTGFPSHRVCRDRGMVHYEWLVNLDQLVGQGAFRFAGYPLSLVGGTGSPVRAIAELG